MEKNGRIQSLNHHRKVLFFRSIYDWGRELSRIKKDNVKFSRGEMLSIFITLSSAFEESLLPWIKKRQTSTLKSDTIINSIKYASKSIKIVLSTFDYFLEDLSEIKRGEVSYYSSKVIINLISVVSTNVDLLDDKKYLDIVNRVLKLDLLLDQDGKNLVFQSPILKEIHISHIFPDLLSRFNMLLSHKGLPSAEDVCDIFKEYEENNFGRSPIRDRNLTSTEKIEFTKKINEVILSIISRQSVKEVKGNANYECIDLLGRFTKIFEYAHVSTLILLLHARSTEDYLTNYCQEDVELEDNLRLYITSLSQDSFPINYDEFDGVGDQLRKVSFDEKYLLRALQYYSISIDIYLSRDESNKFINYVADLYETLRGKLGLFGFVDSLVEDSDSMERFMMCDSTSYDVVEDVFQRTFDVICTRGQEYYNDIFRFLNISDESSSRVKDVIKLYNKHASGTLVSSSNYSVNFLDILYSLLTHYYEDKISSQLVFSMALELELVGVVYE